MHSEETKMKFAELRALGQSYDRIAAELKVSKLTLIRWAEEYEIQIKNLKSAAWDNAVSEFSAAKKDRLEFLASILRKIQSELKSRDFSEVSPEKLVEIAIKMLMLLLNLTVRLFLKTRLAC